MNQSGKSPRNFTVFALIVLSLAYVGPKQDEAQATADALEEAQQAIQTNCGGPEAHWEQMPDGTVQCYLKNGKRSKKS